MKCALMILFLSLPALAKHGEPKPSDYQFYRDMTLKIRPEATFKVPMPSGADMVYSYKLEFADPVYDQPMIGDTHYNGEDSPTFSRSFYDRILLKDGSYVNIGGENLPLTCVFIRGQDNRFGGVLPPYFPQFIMQIYLVANDYSCAGPVRPGWPENGGKREAWDTYAYFEVRDLTIMLPVEAHVRYRWNEFKSVLVK